MAETKERSHFKKHYPLEMRAVCGFATVTRTGKTTYSQSASSAPPEASRVECTDCLLRRDDSAPRPHQRGDARLSVALGFSLDGVSATPAKPTRSHR